MPPVGDDPVAQCARPAPRRPHHHHRHPPRTPELHRSPQNRNISKKNCSKKKLAKRRPGGPSGVAPLTDAAIAAAPNRIERKWNWRRRPGRPSGSRCRPRARESMDKEEERAAALPACCDRRVGEADPVPESAAAIAGGEQRQTNSSKINRRRRGPKRGADSPRRAASPRARARMRDSIRELGGGECPGRRTATRASQAQPEPHHPPCRR